MKHWSGIGVALALCAGLMPATPAAAAPRTWIGLSNTWNDGGSTAFWSPADEPDADDEAIFNTADSVDLGSNNTIAALSMSGGIDLSTVDFDLNVGGLIQLSGNSTQLFIGEAASVVTAHDVIINSGGRVELSGGTLVLNETDLFLAGSLATQVGGTMAGHGTLNFADGPLFEATLFTNNGTLTALSRSSNILFPPPVGTLAIDGNALMRIDLDGAGESGVININRNQTLDINVAASDAFNGDLNMFQGSTLDMGFPWSMGAGGTIDIDNGAVDGLPAIPAGISTIAGAALTMAGGTLTVMDADGTLQFDAPFSMVGGTFTNNGLVIFNANGTIGVLGLDLDSGDWRVQNNALFTANVTDYDPGVITKAFDAIITLDNADISVTTGSAEFVMNGSLIMSSTLVGQATEWSGEPLDIGDDAGFEAYLDVNGDRISRIIAPVDFNSDANVDIGAGAVLEFNSTVNFDTMNGFDQAVFGGAGTVRFNGPVNFNEALTLDMAGGTVDFDGIDDAGDLILISAQLGVSAAQVSDFGRANGGGGVNVIQVDALSVGATGSLTVNLDDPEASWRINPQGALVLVNTNAPVTMLAGSDVDLGGSLNVTGAVGSAARLDISGTVNIQTASPNGGLLLQGGTLADPNRLENGAINGPGELQAANLRALAGHGTITAPINFEGASELVADGDILNLNGGVIDVGVIRVGPAPSTLRLGVPVNLAVSNGGIVLEGGNLQNSGVTTAAALRSMRGTGAVNSEINNNGALEAQGGMLMFSNHNSDWDGGGNTGLLGATGGGTLEIVDNATFPFGGTVAAEDGGRVFAKEFAFDFGPASAIVLDGGTYESDSTTDIAGSVTVGAGAASTIKVRLNFFLDIEPTAVVTLNGDLVLDSNNANIETGATFSGVGALIVPDNRHLVADAGSVIDVLLDMQGSFRPAGFDTVGRVDLRDYQQAETGELFVEVEGTALNQFDRLVVDGDVVLDGFLDVDLDGGFVPEPGNTFTIISANSVTGTFAEVQTSGFPDDLRVELNYGLASVQVVVAVLAAGDLDQDGDVDADDWFGFSICMGGPDNNAPPDGCTFDHFFRSDFDEDADVDMDDAAVFTSCFSGPDVPGPCAAN